MGIFFVTSWEWWCSDGVVLSLAVQENQPYLRNRKAYELQTWYTDGVRCPALRTCGLIAKVKVTRRLKVGVEVTTCRGRDILWQPHYRLHSLFAFRGCDL